MEQITLTGWKVLFVFCSSDGAGGSEEHVNNGSAATVWISRFIVMHKAGIYNMGWQQDGG